MRTTKLSLAAALVSLGAGVDHIDRSDPRHMEFHLAFSSPIMEEKKWFDQNVRAWERRELLVNAQDFVDALQTLKSEVHR